MKRMLGADAPDVAESTTLGELERINVELDNVEDASALMLEWFAAGAPSGDRAHAIHGAAAEKELP